MAFYNLRALYLRFVCDKTKICVFFISRIRRYALFGSANGLVEFIQCPLTAFSNKTTCDIHENTCQASKSTNSGQKQ